MSARRRQRARTAREKPRRRWRLRLLLALTVIVSAAYLGQRPTLGRLRGQHAELRARFATLVARDPWLGRVPDTDLALGVPSAYTQRLAENAADYLLERVPLRFADIRFRKQGDVDKKLLFAGVHLGQWSLDVHIRTLTGSVRGGRPRLRQRDAGPIGVTVPVTLEDARAAGTLRFSWDSSGVANVLCRDFALALPVEASVVAEPHAFEGRVRVEVDGHAGSLLAVAGFDEQTLRARVDPAPQTWDLLRRRLEAQDTFWRCGIGLKPDDVVARLRELAQTAFPVTLPARDLRPLRVPASFNLWLGQAAPVELRVSPATVTTTRDVLWYGARVEARSKPATPPHAARP